MSAFLLHQGATVICVHAGQAQPSAVSPRVKVAGQAVVTQPSPYTITGCSHTVGSSPSPCVTAQWLRAATRVRVGGQPVLLQDSQALCIPNGTGLQVISTQTRVKGQ